MYEKASFSNAKLQAVLNHLLILLSQNNQAEILMCLFAYHKTYLEFWVALKEAFIQTANTHKDFYTIHSIINASTRHSLSESCVEFPGLSSILLGLKNDDQIRRSKNQESSRGRAGG